MKARYLFLIAMMMLVASVTFGAVTVVVNGSNHTIPQTNERGWGSAVTAWIQSISLNTLQPSGGTFTLTADVNFGATYGLKTAYLSSRTANPSTAGNLRLARTDYIGWRNAANSGNLLLAVDGSDNLTFAGVALPTAAAGNFADNGFNIYDNGDATKKIAFQASGIATATTRTITVPDANVDLGALENSNISGSAAIDYSKLNLTGSLLNADVNASAAIAYSKLNLTTSIVNGDVSTSAAIARSKIATGNTNRLVVNDGSTGALSDATAITASRALISDANGIPAHSSVTSTELGYVSGVTSAIQTQLGTKITNPMDAGGDLIYGGASGVPTKLVNGSSGNVLTSQGGTSAPIWAAPAAALPAYRAVTTTDSPSATTDEILNLSGASFTVTLPTAVGNTGKVFRLIHSGTSLTQAYTLNTTSAQTIGGIASGSYVLHTNGEVLVISSNGANWIILEHHARTGWISAGTITLTSGGANHAKGTTATDVVYWKREGQDALIKYRYRQTAAGTNGTGPYYLATPANFPLIDTAIVGVSATGALATVTSENSANVLVSGAFAINSSATGPAVAAHAYSTTTILVQTQTNLTSIGYFGSSQYTLGNTTIGFEVTVRVPMVGWQP